MCNQKKIKLIYKSKLSSRLIVLWLLSLILGASLIQPSIAQPLNQVDLALKTLNVENPDKIRVSRSKNSGVISFLRADPNSPIADYSPSMRTEDRARAFLQSRKDLFLSSSTPADLSVTQVKDVGKKKFGFARFQQFYKGLPVRGGEIVVHMNALGITSVNSKLISMNDDIDITPTVSEQEALFTAKDFTVNQLKYNDVIYSTPKLEIFNEGALRGDPTKSQLAWFIEVSGTASLEYMWIDATNNGVIDHFSQLSNAKARAVYDAKNTANIADNANQIGSEGFPPNIDNLDGYDAYVYFGDTYDFFFNNFGRDSYDDKGHELTATVNYCADAIPPPAGTCNSAKAYWFNNKQGTENFAFSTGFAQADDVVAHEFTHAVIDFTAKLNNVGESGAIVESYGDIFGEAVDLSNGKGNDDASVRWDFGEDLPGGAIRNLMSPNKFGDPERVSDTKYYCGSNDDTAIHTNNGVVNHAFALLVDGGNYNGYTITGIGIVKAAKIFYRTLTGGHLTSTSRFSDLFDALNTAAGELLNEGEITSDDQAQLNVAIKAVELDAIPCSKQIAYCPGGQQAKMLYLDNFEKVDSTDWASAAEVGVNNWIGGNGTAPADVYHTIDPLSGHYSLYANSQPTFSSGDSWVAMTKSIGLPGGGTVRLQFEHNFAFDTADGAVIEYSDDDGKNWQDAGGLISAGQAYNGVLNAPGQPSFPQTLTGREGFVGYMLQNDQTPPTPIFDYASTQLDLSSLAGKNMRIRFRDGTDDFSGSTNYRGWVIDDVAIYTCEPTYLIINPETGLQTTEAGGTATFTVTLGYAPTGSVTINLTSSDATEGDVSPKTLGFNPLNWDQPQTVTVTGMDDTVADGNIAYTINVEISPETTDPGYATGIDPAVVSVTNLDNESSKKSGGATGPVMLIGMLGLLIFTFVNRRHLASKK